MPKGTRVSRCVDKVKKSKDEGAAIAICQDSTNQGYASGKKLKEAFYSQVGRLIAELKSPTAHSIDVFHKKLGNAGAGETKRGEAAIKASDEAKDRRKKRLKAIGESIAAKVRKPGPGKPAKKLKDAQDDRWEKEEKKEGYNTPKSDDTTGYDSSTDDNASDDFKHGRWMKEDPPKSYKKKLKESYIPLAYQLHEALPLLLAPLAVGAKAVGAGVVKGAAVVGRGAAAVGKGAARVGGKVVKAGVEAGGKAVKGAGRMAKNKMKDVAKEKAQEKADELGQQAASNNDLEENKMNNAYVRRLMEDGPTDKDLKDIEKEKPAKIPKKKYFGGATKPGDVDTKAAVASHKEGIRAAGEATKKREDQSTAYHQIGRIIAETEFPKGPTAQRYASKGRAGDTGEGKGTASIKDPLVKKETEKTKANIDKKTQSDTNPKVSDLVQGSMNRRRGESRRRGTGGLPKETPADAKADAQRDKYRRMAPGDK